MEAAEDLPGASVLGVDLSAAAAVAPKFVPGNCRLEVADFEKSWTFVPEEEEKFDFIHGRALGGSVADFRGLLKRVYEGLRPGGWVEFQEYEGGCESDDDTLRLVPALEAWQREVREARGKSRAWVGELKGLLGEAGFVDVQEDRYKVSRCHRSVFCMRLTTCRAPWGRGRKGRCKRSWVCPFSRRIWTLLSRSHLQRIIVSLGSVCRRRSRLLIL